MSKINLQEPQRNCNATANFVNLIMTSTVLRFLLLFYFAGSFSTLLEPSSRLVRKFCTRLGMLKRPSLDLRDYIHNVYIP